MAANKTAPRFRATELIRIASGVERDVLTIVLDPAKDYTKDEAKKLYNDFLTKKGGK